MGQDVLPSNIYLKLLNPKRAEQVALSDRQADLFLRHGGMQVSHVIPFGLDESLRLTQLPQASRDIDILGVGSFIEVKNYLRFVEVVAELHRERPSLKAVLAGKGPQEKEIRERIAHHGLQQVIQMPGLLPREEVLQLMQRSKVFLHPSSYESLGYVFPEALSRGALVVSLAVGSAHANTRWTVCSTEAELAGAVRQWLELAPPAEPLWLGGMRDTAEAYLKLYTALIASAVSK
jgi:glycosyltransferase involved in cell wall biosynthesis